MWEGPWFLAPLLRGSCRELGLEMDRSISEAIVRLLVCDHLS